MADQAQTSIDSFKSRQTLDVDGKSYEYFSLTAAEKNGLGGISQLPASLKVLLENLLRHEDGSSVTKADIEAFVAWLKNRRSDREIAYRPARVLMQDFTGVPAVVDLAAMRDAMKTMGGDPQRINPLVPVDLVIDHSVMVDYFGTGDAFARNVEREYERNRERYEFLKWGSEAFSNFRVVPPGTGICHQVNLEYLAQTVWTKNVARDGREITQAFPDTCVGTDSHTTMVNGLSVLGWGVGGIEAEAAMLGQPISMVIPEVVGFRMTGKLGDGVTATDLVLTVTQMLRKLGVVGKFVEFFGPGLDHLSLEDQATIANMAPEYGATCGFFPTDTDTIGYLKATGRDPHRIALVEAYAKAQGMYRDAASPEPQFTTILELDLASVVPSIAGPKRPQDRVRLADAKSAFSEALGGEFNKASEADKKVAVEGGGYEIGHGDVVIAAITSCTNTSNPSVLIAAGLVARNARAKGLSASNPGSRRRWLRQPGRDRLSGPGRASGRSRCSRLRPGGLRLHDLHRKLGPASGRNFCGGQQAGDLVACSVLSGNRNFEGRVNPGRESQLSGVSAACRGLRACRLAQRRPHEGSAWQRR